MSWQLFGDIGVLCHAQPREWYVMYLRGFYLQAPVVQRLVAALVIIIFTVLWVRFPDMHQFLID
jgi:hypothetical protein